MSSNLPPDTLTRAYDIIIPHVGTEAERTALLTQAFFDFSSLSRGIEITGTARIFTVTCINALLKYGCLTLQEHALSRLLVTVRHQSGVDQHPEIDDLIKLLNEKCSGKKSEPTRPTLATNSPASVPDSSPPAPAAVDPVPPVAQVDSPPPSNDLPTPPNLLPKQPRRMSLAVANSVLIFVIAAFIVLKIFPLLESAQIAVLFLFGLAGLLFGIVTGRNLSELRDEGSTLATRYIDHPGLTVLCLIVLAGGVLFSTQCNGKGCFNPQPDSTEEVQTTTPEQTSTVASEPTTCADADGDGVCDSADACPALYAKTANGCPGEATDTPISQPTSASQANIVPTDTPNTAEAGLPDEASSTADYVNLEIYWDEDSFTLYVPDQGTLNLAELTFVAGNTIISPSEESDIPLDAIESPFCIHFYWQDVDDSSVVPNKCDDATPYSIAYTNRPDVFWLQPNGNRPIVKIDAVVGNMFRESCAYGANWCIPFSP